MPFSTRLWDDHVLTHPEDKRTQPQFASSLLTRLRLTRALREDQERGIREWLSSNEPSRKLANSLTKSGFGHLLNHHS